MGTITRSIAIDIIHSNRYAEDNIQAIVTYNNMFNGALEFATIGPRENAGRYHQSPACRNAQLAWTKVSGLTQWGRSVLPETPQSQIL